jgi:hypothetical protein
VNRVLSRGAHCRGAVVWPGSDRSSWLIVSFDKLAIVHRHDHIGYVCKYK